MVKNTVGKKNNTYFKTFWGIIILGLIVLLPLISAQTTKVITDTEIIDIPKDCDGLWNGISCFIFGDTIEAYSKITIDSKELSKDTIFTTLLSNTASITSGEAIFEVKSPVELNKDNVRFDFTEVQNTILSYEIWINYTNSRQEPVYRTEWIVTECPVINATKGELELIEEEPRECGYNGQVLDKYNTIYFEDWKLLKDNNFKDNKVKIIGNWKAGNTLIDWIPTISIDKDVLGIDKSLVLTKDEWAWWNATITKYVVFTPTTTTMPESPYANKLILNTTSGLGFNYAETSSNGGNLTFMEGNPYAPNDTAGVLPYFVAVWNTTGNSVIYVKTKSLSVVNITMYYNSTQATSLQSKVEDTFFFGDSFDNGETANWTDANNICSVSSSIMTCTRVEDNIIQTNGVYVFNISATRLITRWSLESDPSVNSKSLGFGGINYWSLSTPSLDFNVRSDPSENNVRPNMFSTVNGGTYIKANYSQAVGDNSPYSSGRYNNVEFLLTPSGSYVTVQNIDNKLASNTTYRTGTNFASRGVFVIAVISNGAGNLKYDWVGLSNYTSSEATWTTTEVGNTTFIVALMTTTQSSPVNYFNTTDNTVSISCNYTSTVNNISSVNLTVWDNANNIDYQNTEVLAGEVTNYNKTWTTSALTDGTYNWSCGGFGKAGINQTSGNRTFTLDTTKPTITINYPVGNQGLKTPSYNVTLNYTASDIHLQTCWYNTSYNATINYTTCNQSFNILVPNSLTSNTVYVYANDSLGNSHVNSSTWTLNGFVNNFQWANTTLEGSLNNFYADINLTSGVSINIPKLIYNNTNYTAISTLISGNKYRVSSSINAPSIASDTNITFYWNILLSDSSTYISNTFNQSVFNFSLDNCSAYSYPLFNMTLYDEDLQTKLDGSSDNTSIEVTLTMSDLSNIVIFNYSTKINNMNSAAVCLQNNLSGDNYYLDGIIKYSSLGRFNEFYNIQKYQINSSNVNLPISLYDLNTSTGTEFKITYKDSNFVPVSGALIYLQRKYISEGVYKTVEIPKTGAEGYALAHVVRNDVIYNILVMKNGVLLATFADIVADCQNPTLFSCNINLNSYGSSVLPSSYISGDDLTFSMVYNKSTRTISSSYAIPSGVPSTMSLNVTVFDSLGNTTVFNDNLLSASGELSGVVPSTFGNGTVIATLYKDGVVVGKSIISLAENPTDIYGGSLVFIALFGIILIIGLGISDNPMVMGIMLAIGAVVLVALNIIYSPSLLGVGATILWLIIGIVLVLIKGSDRQ